MLRFLQRRPTRASTPSLPTETTCRHHSRPRRARSSRARASSTTTAWPQPPRQPDRRKEVLTGKAKFGIFGDGKEVAQLAWARAFRKGDWRSGYYRDQTFMLSPGAATLTSSSRSSTPTRCHARSLVAGRP